MRTLRVIVQSLISLILIIAFTIAVIYFLLRRPPYLPPEELPKVTGGFTDLHVHTAGIGAGNSGCFVNERLRSDFRFPIFLRAFGVEVEDVKREGDEVLLTKIASGIRESRFVGRAIVLAMDGVYNELGELNRERTQIYIPNAYLANAVNKYSELEFGASVNPYRRDALEELDRVVAAGTRLIKWIPSIMEIDPSDEAIFPFYQRMLQHGLVLLTHTGDENAFPEARNELADPFNLRLPLELGLRVIAAHAGTTGKNDGMTNVTRLQRMMEEYPNLYADTSSLTQVNKMPELGQVLSPAPNNLIKSRLLYGSDMPLINTVLVSPLYFFLFLSQTRIRSLLSITNPWDRDVLLKQALGFPADSFLRIEDVLKKRP